MQKYQRLVFATSMISFMFTGFGAGAQESPPPAQPDLQKLRPLTVEEFKEALPTRAEELHLKGFRDLIKQGSVVVLDVRSKESFAKRHLKDSVNAPLTDLTEKNLPQLVPDKNTPVVLACDYSFMPVRMLAMTIQAYPVLKANGYTKIYRLNLWSDPEGGDMADYAAQEKALAFEGSEVKPAAPK
ncbi:MAG: rhodanese-like domain-containing protein [Alphaproteobacteria bacterium]|nr:MAG: rhodanese-like domain-containing protein [Alphaproteobacteria bacterium]